MLFKSPLFSQASGSLAGNTFSHNRGGMYVRARAIPTNPGSSFQTSVRSALATLASWWGQSLSSGERDAWDSYAAGTVMTNKLGDQVYLTGQNHFLRCNVPRIQAGLSILEAAPYNFDLGSYTLPTISAVDDDENVSIAFTNTDAWASAVGGYMLAYVSRPQGAGVNFFKGPFRYMDKVAGAVVPPSSPEVFTSPFTFEIGQKVWVQLRIIQVDGRLSSPIILGPQVVEAAA